MRRTGTTGEDSEMGDAARAEADALMAAISGLLPFRNGAAVDAIPPLRAALAMLIVPDHHAPTKAATEAASSLNGANPTPLRPAKPVTRAFQAGGKRRLDPRWPAIRNRIQAAMSARSIGPTALARAVKIPPGTLRKYLADRAPPPDIRERLVAWLEQADATAPAASEQPPAPRAAPPPVKAREGAAPPPPTFPGSRAPFRLGAAEAAARA
jgi:hypothetical protein